MSILTSPFGKLHEPLGNVLVPPLDVPTSGELLAGLDEGDDLFAGLADGDDDDDDQDDLDRQMEEWRRRAEPQPSVPAPMRHVAVDDADEDESSFARALAPREIAPSHEDLVPRRKAPMPAPQPKPQPQPEVRPAVNYLRPPTNGAVYKRGFSFDGKTLYFPFQRFKLLDAKLKVVSSNRTNESVLISQRLH